ncbi:hypothetical protein KCP73_17240 [Salmonella enterica subsp. enterica]|nr:hypothetical protein KCP73_17240 [Salmonella enterica subsp. enterica]
MFIAELRNIGVISSGTGVSSEMYWHYLDALYQRTGCSRHGEQYRHFRLIAFVHLLLSVIFT